jgi:hypothetical protein
VCSEKGAAALLVHLLLHLCHKWSPVTSGLRAVSVR